MLQAFSTLDIDDRAAPAPRRLVADYPALPPSVRVARRTVTDWLDRLDVEPLLISDVALALSEACANTVLHAYRDGRPGGVRVTAEHDGEHVVLTVTDDGCGMSPRSDSPGLGLGLPLIATLAEDVEVRTGPDGTGTEVTMRFSLEASRRRVGQVNDKRPPAH